MKKPPYPIPYTLYPNRGFSLLEMAIYVAILSLMAVIVVNTTLSLSASWNSVRVSRDINSAAVTSLERMGREIRAAVGIDVAQSVFDAHPGVLVLTGATTIEFSLKDGVLTITENDIETGALMKNTVTATNLVFRRVVNGTKEGVRIEMTLESSRGKIIKSKNFYSFITLRSSYQQ